MARSPWTSWGSVVASQAEVIGYPSLANTDPLVGRVIGYDSSGIWVLDSKDRSCCYYPFASFVAIEIKEAQSDE